MKQDEKAVRCLLCGGPPQLCGSTYLPRYVVHCLRCGQATEHFSDPDSAISRWNFLNQDNN